ncbi:hypothetical protein AXG93_2116s1160 [Marchantia polymorpha subsp. ruderalis]|uniref:F-box domain-containing protein n=1 Tax=Marchantia polymorpha subsp. ruderalis TaxID=1480154 RepID=A0A176VME1_MARPO|nr:hypothetical protein AXG93_2116s1160 [Marchantia polymorpha subsp. ruderalis]
MRRSDRELSKSEDCEVEDLSLIPGLPDDLAFQCLVRVPRRYHWVLAAVCRRWQETLCSTMFCSKRKEMGLSEGWVYALLRDSSEDLHWHVMDPTQRVWKELPKMPGDATKRYGLSSEVINRELFVVGGGQRYKPPIREVLKFNPITNAWKEAASLEMARHYFASAVFEGKLFAVGGMGTTSESQNSYEIYDPKSQTWSTFYDAHIVTDLGEALVLDAVTDQGDVYMLDQTFGLKIMMLNHGSLEWIPVGRLSPKSITPPCKLVFVKNILYIVGRGLQTISYNLDKGHSSRGMLATSSIPALEPAEDVVLSCHMIEI